MYELADEISELLDQPIRTRGVNAMFLCPFHDERTPSFSIHLNEGVWHCFGCQKSGHLEALYRELGERMTDDVYIKRMLQRAKDPEPQRLYDFRGEASQYRTSLQGGKGADLAARYIRQRALHPDVVRHFAIGYSEQRDSLTLPYWDTEGRVTGIKYRHRDDSKTSLTGSEYGLYGVSYAVGKPTVYIAEGESDTHALWTALRTRPDVGVCGTSGSPTEEGRWSRYALSLMFAGRVYICHDADDSGDACAEAAMRMLGVDKCVRLRPTLGKDMTEHILAGGTIEQLGG